MIERFGGRYSLLKRLGRGGMGEVFLARDLASGRECALKRIEAGGSIATSDSARREFEALARVRHPAVVEVFDLGISPEGQTYYTMEYVPGLPADRALMHGDWRSLARVAGRVAYGLEALHAAGVIHGDLKPSNVLVVPSGDPSAPPEVVRLVDFGLATLRGNEAPGHRGTAGFTAPEIVQGAAPGVSSDLYALGATLYALAAGRPAFQGRDIGATLRVQQGGPAPSTPLAEAGVPEAMQELILSLLAPVPGERPASALEVRLEIERMAPEARWSMAERLRSVRVVGRERELARVEAWLAGERRGTTVLMITGPSGIGRSALLDELAVRGQLAGRDVIRLAPGNAHVPGAAVRVLMRALLARDVSSTASGRVDPRWSSPEAASLTEADESAFADQVLERAHALGVDRAEPLVLVDDVDALDAASERVLRRIAVHPRGRALRMIWAYAADPPSDADLALIKSGRVEALALGVLDRDGLDRLVASRLNQAAPVALATYLWSRTEGHPGLTIEMLRRAATTGALREDESGVIVDPARLETLELPSSFDATRLERLQALAEGARATAAALAAWGRPATAVEIAALAPAATAADLEGLIAARLAERDAEGRTGLRPARLAGPLLAGIPADERRALHRAALATGRLTPAERFRHLRGVGDDVGALAAVSEAFGLRADPGLALEAAEVAERVSGAEGASWWERAAAGLMDQGRHATAIPYLDRALELEGEGPANARRRRLRVTALLRSGSRAEAASAVGLALAADPPPAVRAMLQVDEASRLALDGATEEAESVAREALATAEASADDEAIAVAALTLGGMLHFRGRLEEARALLARAEEAGGRAGNPSTGIRARGQRGMIAADAGDLDAADRLYRSALDQAGACGARLAEEESRLGLAGLLVRRGLWKEARAEYAAAERIALEDGRPRGAVLALANLALLDGLAGRPRASRRQAIRALELARAFAPRLASPAWRAHAIAHRVAGHWRAAERAARRALASAHSVGREADAAWASVELARVMAATGRWSRAGEVCGAGSGRPGAGEDPAVAVLHAWSGRSAVRAGRLESARRSLGLAVRMLARQPSPYATLHVELLRAEVQLAAGRTSEGMSTAGRCLAGFSSLGAPPDRAHAALELGRLTSKLPAGPEPVAASWLEEAAAAFERLGNHRSREQALATLVECRRQARPEPAPRLSDRGLIESVSRLLGSLSDPREVAQRSMELAVEQLGAERGVLLLAEPETGRLVPIAEHGAVDAALRSEAMGYSRRVVERVADTGGSLLVADAPTDPRTSSESVVGLQLRSIVCVPMYVGGRVVGAVYLDDSRRPELFSESDRSLLEGFAHLMAVAIEKSRGHSEVERANEKLVGENLSLRQEVALRFQTDALIGFSAAMQRVLATVERAGQANASVLVTGENGTGKELIARVLHHSGKRRLGPFVTVNCGAIPHTLLESELFGILPSVATGVRGRDGRFVQADGGTLFLDEVGEMPLDQQVALLSVLANREVTPVGGGRPIPVDVRVVAASNRDLRQAIEERKFREDLYYRLSVIPIELPPLRERKADIPALAHRFVAMFARQQEREAPRLSSEFMAVLMQSDWPGNVRELQNYIERVMVMTPGPVLHPRPLPRDLERQARPALASRRRLADAVAELETRMLREALQRTDGNQTRAARELGLTEQSLRYRLRKLDVLPTRRNRRTRRK